MSSPVLAKELAASSGFLLARLGLAFKAEAIRRLEEEGFEPYHYSVLAILAEGARETQSTIADALAIDPSRLVPLLDGLEEQGCIARHRDAHDRRRYVVSITPAGTRQLERLRQIARRLEDEFFGALSANDRETFNEILRELAAARDPRCAFARAAD